MYKWIKRLWPITGAALLVFVFVLPAQAKSKTYLYRSRANWVKLVELKKKQIGDTVLEHPQNSLSTEILENMLLSITLNRSALFGKEVKELGVFTVEEARKYAAFIVQGLKSASPNQVINVAVIHQRPHFIIRADYLSIFNVYVTGEGVHFYFNKIFARLDGDYEQASQMDAALSRAKSARVTIKPMPGQRLAYHDGQEIIMDPAFNFAANSIVPRAETVKSEYQMINEPRQAPVASAPATGNQNDIKSRLSKLEELKKSGLITTQEYQQKKKDILNSL